MVPVRLDRVNVAVHVRRGFDANSTEMPERNFGGALQPNPRYMNLEIVETVMNQIRHKHKANPKRHGGKALLFHIYSIGDPKEFDGMVAHGDVQLQLDRQAAETWHAMATADILVTSTSTLSFTAALVNTHAEVYYAMTIFQNLIPGFIPFDAHAILEPMKGICPLDKAPTPPPGSHHPSRPAHQLQRRLAVAAPPSPPPETHGGVPKSHKVREHTHKGTEPNAQGEHAKDKASSNFKSKANATLVVMFGSIRGGEATWTSFYQNVLNPDINPDIELALSIGSLEPNDPVRNSSLLQRARFIWFTKEVADWGEHIDALARLTIQRRRDAGKETPTSVPDWRTRLRTASETARSFGSGTCGRGRLRLHGAVCATVMAAEYLVRGLSNWCSDGTLGLKCNGTLTCSIGMRGF